MHLVLRKYVFCACERDRSHMQGQFLFVFLILRGLLASKQKKTFLKVPHEKYTLAAKIIAQLHNLTRIFMFWRLIL